MLTSFEARLKDTIERHEAPLNEEGWKFIEQHLATGSAQSGGSAANWVAWLAASLVLAVSSWLVYDYNFDVPEASLAGGADRIQHWRQPLSGHATENSATSSESDSFNNTQTSESATLTQGAQNAQLVNALAAQNDRNDSGSVSETQEMQPGTSEPVSQSTNVAQVPAKAENAALFHSSVRESCAGSSVDFKLANNPGAASYLWNFGDGTFSSQPNPNHIYTKPGIYDVSLSITGENGLIKSTVMEDLITINPTPESEFEWDFVSGATDEPTAKFINLSENATKFSWTFDEKTLETEISPVKSYITKGKHSVKLYVENEFGCSDETVRYLTINSDYNLLAPAAISPNKDGVDDSFMPEALRNNNFNFSMTVYDGSKPIYTTSNKNKPWEGKLKDGSAAPVGTSYPWVVIIYNSITKEEKYFSGSVTIAP
ncbi:MAG: PKD domain-containing protein [Flavobacteriales bacterium]|nr:PKD domain-containing protein [Flavobacteriales bacterium]